MKKLLIILLAFVSLTSAFAQQDKRLKGIEVELKAILEVTKAPGFAVAVVEGKKIIYAKGFGYSDYEKKIPVDANTLFAIGSCSKAFTSTILGQLQQENKISLDESPIKYVPELKFFNDELNNHVIIKDLMFHSTGIPRHDYSWYFFPSNSKDSLMHRIAYQESFTGLRMKWNYNNFMFLVQGVIAERITGRSWEDNIEERFFKPLGMDRSNVSIKEMQKSSNIAIGYKLKKDSIISKTDYYHIAGMSPAGSINSSVNDMSKWLITWINKGNFNGQQIIPKNYYDEAISSQMVVRGALPDKEFSDIFLANYGYAWFISSYKGHYRVEHGGNIDGFSANTTFLPSDSIGVVVLANQDGSAVPSYVRNTIIDRMLNLSKTNWAKVYAERRAKAKKEEKELRAKSSAIKIKNTKPSHILQEYLGKYSNSGYGDFIITIKNDSLFANFKLKKIYLRHLHYDIFEAFEVTKDGVDTTDAEPPQFNFCTNNIGEISFVKVDFEKTLKHAIEFKHKPNKIEVDKATLAKYVGDFELSGTNIKVYTKNENKLYLYVVGQPEYELLATDKHKFVFLTLEGFKVEFVESTDKSINEIVFTQPNGIFRAKRK